MISAKIMAEAENVNISSTANVLPLTVSYLAFFGWKNHLLNQVHC